MSHNKFAKASLIIFLAVFFYSCIDQVDAEYDYRDNVIFVDAYALTEMGTSTVTISRSYWDERVYSVRDVLNAKVNLENVTSGTTIDFMYEDDGVYLCPPDFAAKEGEVWKLYIELEDGRKFESTPETVMAAIPIDEITAEYSPEITYDITRDKLVPGHRIGIDWQDPAGTENYYLWKYRTFQPLYVCKTCVRGIFRNGACQASTFSFGPPYQDYLCDPVCWQIEYEEQTIIFEDRLSDGQKIENREITILPFTRRPDILIEVQQLTLNKSAYDYFKVINDQVSESGGLNAPPPAPLLGNLFNPNDANEYVLGQFTTAGVSTKSLFIERSMISENPIDPDPQIILEQCLTCPKSFPCEEGRNRTSIKPEGWQ